MADCTTASTARPCRSWDGGSRPRCSARPRRATAPYRLTEAQTGPRLGGGSVAAIGTSRLRPRLPHQPRQLRPHRLDLGPDGGFGVVAQRQVMLQRPDGRRAMTRQRGRPAFFEQVSRKEFWIQSPVPPECRGLGPRPIRWRRSAPANVPRAAMPHHIRSSPRPGAQSDDHPHGGKAPSGAMAGQGWTLRHATLWPRRRRTQRAAVSSMRGIGRPPGLHRTIAGAVRSRGTRGPRPRTRASAP